MATIIHELNLGENMPFQRVLLNQYEGNGGVHLYAEDDQGRKRHISYDKFLESYGHTARPRNDKPTSNTVDVPLPLEFVSDEPDQDPVISQEIENEPAEETPRSAKSKLILGATAIGLAVGRQSKSLFERTKAAWNRRKTEKEDTEEPEQAKEPKAPTRLMMAAGARMVAAQSFRAEKTVNDDRERRDDRRAAIGIVVLGVGALALTAYFAKEGLHMPGIGHGRDAADSLPQPSIPSGTPVPATHEPLVIIPSTPLELKPDVSPDTVHAVRNLAEGQNPWSVSIDHARSLGYEPSMRVQADVQFIDAVKDRVLCLNNVSEQGSYNLEVGHRLRMPHPQWIADQYRKYHETSGH